MKSFVLIILTITSLFLTATSFAGGEDGGPGIINSLPMMYMTPDGMFVGEFNNQLFQSRISAVKFVDVNSQGVVFRAKTPEGRRTFLTPEVTLETSASLLIDAVEKSYNLNDAWVEL